MPLRFSSSFRRRTLQGFTLVELLVVIAIIGILVALLLPAVQAAREAARRTSCQNHLKQLGLACLNYHDSFKRFPPALQLPDDTRDISRSTDYGPNWVIEVLPFAEQSPLHDTFNFEVPISDPLNREQRGTRLDFMVCPSDPNSEAAPYQGLSAREGDNWARGSYGANGSLGFMHETYRPAGGPDKRLWKDPQTRGVMGMNTAARIAQITDGTSSTIMIAELRIGLSPVDRRGTWALGGAGSSSIWGHGTDNANGPNVCLPGSDNIQGCRKIIREVGQATLDAECMTCDELGNEQAAPRSTHVGGIYVAMCDGSVQFINDLIERGVQWEPDPEEFRAWQRLNASGDGQIVEGFDI